MRRSSEPIILKNQYRVSLTNSKSGWKNLFSIFILLVFSFASYSQSAVLKFKRISTEQGLSQNHVLCIIQDSKGFMWFGTADGLNRYDGYNFKVYKNVIGDSTTLPNNYITTICEDSKGVLWIG